MCFYIEVFLDRFDFLYKVIVFRNYMRVEVYICIVEDWCLYKFLEVFRFVY